MTRGRPLLALVAATAALALCGLAPAPVSAGISPGNGVDLLAQHGFGTAANGYAWGMAWFKGRLYVGTGRQVACVEAWTRAYYLPNLQPYTTNPSVNTRCPADPNDMSLRAEIWRYTPEGGTWQRVYRSPVVRNPRATGKVVGRDIAYRGMAVHDDPKGRPTLWITGVTANEYLPELQSTDPPRLLHTRDGRHFTARSPSASTTVTTLTGTQKPIGFRSMQWLHGRMYMTASTGLTGDGAAVEVTRPLGRRLRLRQVSPTDLAVFEIQAYGRRLYLGTGDHRTGYGVYRAWDNRPRPDRWTTVLDRGAGRGVRLTSVVSMHRYRGRLYVGSSGWLNEERTLPATEVIRLDRAGRWDVVAGAPRTYDRDLKFPVSGLGDGWGTGFTAHPWRMATVGGTLYVGTNDFSSTLINQGYPLLQSMLASGYGFDVWASCDGDYWFPVTYDAFGGNPFDFGARTMVPTPRGLAVGSADHAMGTAVFMATRNPCKAGIRRVKGAPGSLMADPQRNGTVVSWRPAAAGSTYRVLRAELPAVDVSVKGPPAMPNGFSLEDDAPEVVPPGTPGATTTSVLGYGGFEPVGTTRRSVFVDAGRVPGRRYAYRVLAEPPGGGATGTSGVQVVPDPSPPPSVAGVRRALRSHGRAVARTAGDGPATLRALRHAAGRDPRLRDLVDRLARRDRYRQLAGGR